MFEHMPLILAQENAPPTGFDSADQGQPIEGQPSGAPGGTQQPQQQPGGSMMPMVWMIGLVAMFWLIIMGPQRKEKKRRAAMLSALGKGDKIQTVGGILGTVIEVREADVVVKVDENANTRLRIARSAIQSIVQDQQE